MNITPFATAKPDPQALDVARWVHKKAGAYATYLFGSRARGDYRSDSDIDILLITPGEEDENWLDALEEEARQAQQEQHGMKTGIDVLSMTPEEFNRRRRLINNLAWTIAREGILVMAPERLGYGSNRNDDEEDLNYAEIEENLEIGDAETVPGGTDTEWAEENERIASLGVVDEVSQSPE